MRQRLLGVIFVGMLFLLFSLSFVSAAGSSSAAFNHRYQGPSGSSSSNYYFNSNNDGSGSYDHNGNYRYPNQQYATKPIFKGSYGNYRYQGYANGDVRPSFFFRDYPESYNRPYFSGGSFGGYGLGNNFGGYGGGYYGGFGGYGGYGGYNGYSGLGISRYQPSYSYNNYGNNYYPSYDYQYLGGCGYSYC